LLADDPGAGDQFGTTVAISGDTAVVGSPADDTVAGTNAGSAYVYARSGAAWTEQAHLFASDGAASDFYGISVGISGTTVVVGAEGDDNQAGIDAGSAYVYTLQALATPIVVTQATATATLGQPISDTATVTGASPAPT